MIIIVIEKSIFHFSKFTFDVRRPCDLAAVRVLHIVAIAMTMAHGDRLQFGWMTGTGKFIAQNTRICLAFLRDESCYVHRTFSSLTIFAPDDGDDEFSSFFRFACVATECVVS